MNFGKLFPLVAMALSVYSAAASNDAPAPVSVPIYYGRPNNGGYPYPTPTPATKPYENKTETPTPQAGQSIMDARTTADILTPLQLHTILKEAIQARTER
ncbi:hypothetical protein GQ600_19438 [Phytophthora cactorum]|nr:hypothetical protein GQ600_19438 [Phytophthora cactorum]